MSFRPCVYPRCRDTDGNPRQTNDVICDGCRRHYRKVLDWLIIDWLTLQQFPTPAPAEADGSKHQAARAKSFGHPAEWASDTMREVAQLLNWAEASLRWDLGHADAVDSRASERVLLGHAYRYLTIKFDRLCSYPSAAEAADELDSLHRKIRRRLGHTRFVQRLPIPCPWCEVAALMRSVGQIECGDCGKVIDETHYDWLANYTIDAMIDAYDAMEGVSP